MGVVTFAGWFVVDLLDPFNDATFNAAAWAKLDAQERAAMSRDLIQNHLPTGMSHAAVESLLGPPYRVIRRSDAGGHRLPGVETYSYYIGSWSMYGFDDAFVYVHLDASGNVLSSEITGY